MHYCTDLVFGLYRKFVCDTFFVESILRMLPNVEVSCALVSSIRPTTSRMYTARNQAGFGTGCMGGIG